LNEMLQKRLLSDSEENDSEKKKDGMVFQSVMECFMCFILYYQVFKKI